MILDFSKKRKIIFPESYVHLLESHNALRPKKKDIYFEIGGNKDSRDVNFLGFGTEVDEDESIDEYQDEECSPEGIIVFAVAANGDYFAFDYRNAENKNNPPVILMFHDNFDENDYMIYVKLAPNFTSFLNLLN